MSFELQPVVRDRNMNEINTADDRKLTSDTDRKLTSAAGETMTTTSRGAILDGSFQKYPEGGPYYSLHLTTTEIVFYQVPAFVLKLF